MLSQGALQRALAAAGLDAPARWADVTDSTNREAVELARSGAPAWSVVATGHQTAGRGRAGRSWVDRPGRAVMFSVVLRPVLEADMLGVVSLAAGAAMAEAASDLADVDVRCKWPNDLLVDDAKVGGVLLESEVERDHVRYVAVGVGINLDAPPGVPGAGGIGDVDPEALVTRFLRRLRMLVDGAPTSILSAWRARSDTLGRDVAATTVEGAVVRGRAIDVDAAGALVVATDGGRARVAFGNVTHLRATTR